MHAATSTPLADRVRLMAHPSVMRAFTAPNSVRLFQTTLPAGFPGGHVFRDGSLLVMLRPACWLGRLARPCRCLRRRQARPFTAELAPARVSPSRGLLWLLGPTIHCRGRTCTCKHVKDRRLHLAVILHRGIEQRSGERVRRLVNTEPNETATHRFFHDRL